MREHEQFSENGGGQLAWMVCIAVPVTATASDLGRGGVRGEARDAVDARLRLERWAVGAGPCICSSCGKGEGEVGTLLLGEASSLTAVEFMYRHLFKYLLL